MKIIELDGRPWKSNVDFYDALADALGSVEWHGRNSEAFLETMVYYLHLNEVQPPYQVRVSNVHDEMRILVEDFARWLAEARRVRRVDPGWGDDVEVSMQVL